VTVLNRVLEVRGPRGGRGDLDGTIRITVAVPLVGDATMVCPAMKQIRAQISIVARVDVPILILGESRVGKEVLAHRQGAFF
jgi:hypothetical protein